MTSLAHIFETPEQRQKLFLELGEFIFEFSQLEFTLRSIVARSLELENDLFDTITAPYDFVKLCQVAKHVVSYRLRIEKARTAWIEKSISACLSLNENRVRIAHGLWSIDGRGSQARHVSRNSLKPAYYFESPGSITTYIYEAKELNNKFVQLLIYFSHDDGYLPDFLAE